MKERWSENERMMDGGIKRGESWPLLLIISIGFQCLESGQFAVFMA